MVSHSILMLLLPIHTRLLKKGDDLASLLSESTQIVEGDILVISSKAIATMEGAAIDLRKITISKDADKWSKACGRSAAFCQAILDELERLHGKVVGTCPGALLTELRPTGLSEGTIFAANAGLDQSNVEDGFAVGWPRDPVESVKKLQEALYSLSPRGEPACLQAGTMVRGFGVILSDSCCIPRRRGVTAHALVVSGIDPLFSEIGNNDLFGKPLRITIEARADQLATAANILMGNAGQLIPAVIIRDHGIPLTRFESWVPGIEPEEDLFQGIFSIDNSFTFPTMARFPHAP